MRKALFSLFAVTLVAAFMAVSVYAAEATKAMGTLKSIDAAKGTVVFCPEGSKEDITMKADKGMLKDIKAGDKVKIEYAAEGKSTVVKSMMKVKTRSGFKVPVGC